MDFYFFTSDFDFIKELEDIGFEGVLFTYNANNPDCFIKIAKNISHNTKIKHMVAIRPYVISPQYLTMITKSMNDIANGILQINFISGYIKDEEKNFGGVLGNVNDLSSSIDRSNYLIDYIEMLESMDVNIIDYYIAVTNDFTFSIGMKHDSKMIIPYSQYRDKRYNLNKTKSMISVTPILRETQKEIDDLQESTVQHKTDMENFTYDQFENLVNDIKNDNINKIILSAWNMEETMHIVNFVKQYKIKEKMGI